MVLFFQKSRFSKIKILRFRSNFFFRKFAIFFVRPFFEKSAFFKKRLKTSEAFFSSRLRKKPENRRFSIFPKSRDFEKEKRARRRRGGEKFFVSRIRVFFRKCCPSGLVRSYTFVKKKTSKKFFDYGSERKFS